MINNNLQAFQQFVVLKIILHEYKLESQSMDQEKVAGAIRVNENQHHAMQACSTFQLTTIDTLPLVIY